MTPAQALVRQHGGNWHGSCGTVPGSGHSKRDRSVTVIDGEHGAIINSFAGKDWRELRHHCLGEGGPVRQRLSKQGQVVLKAAEESERELLQSWAERAEEAQK